MAKPKDVIKQIEKATQRQFSADEKNRIVLVLSPRYIVGYGFFSFIRALA